MGPIYVIFFIVHTFVIILNPEDIKVCFGYIDYFVGSFVYMQYETFCYK